MKKPLNALGDDLIRAIDVKALHKRLSNDNRCIKEIAKAAGISYTTFYLAYSRGSATIRTINKIRLAVNPRMNFFTISPEDIQPDHIKKLDAYMKTDFCESASGNELSDESNFDYEKEVQFYKALSDDFEKLCDKYSVFEVLSMASDIQSQILMYMRDSGFNLLELYDEAVKDIPHYEGKEEE